MRKKPEKHGLENIIEQKPQIKPKLFYLLSSVVYHCQFFSNFNCLRSSCFLEELEYCASILFVYVDSGSMFGYLHV